MAQLSEKVGQGSEAEAAPQRDAFALLSATRRNDLILERSTDGLWIIDAAGFILEVNPAAYHMLGYEKQQLIGKHVNDIDALETPERTRQRMAAVSAVGSHRFETRHRRKDGVVIDVEVTAHSAELDGEGFFFAFLRDISERKQAQGALRKSQAMIQEIVEMAPVAIIEIGADDTVLTWNRTAEVIFGWKAHEVIGRRLPIVEDDRRDEFRRRYDPEGRGTRGIEVQRRRKDGSLVEVAIWTAARRNEAGAIVSSLGIMVDITERRRAESALRESEAKWRSLVENAPGFILVLDREGRLQFINRVLPQFDMAQVLQASAYDFLGPEDAARARRVLATVFNRRESASIDVVALGHGGMPAWFSCTCGPIVQDDQVVAAIGIVHDVTERRRAEEALRSRNELERLLFRELDHRVRNNLSALISLVDMVRDRATDAQSLARGIRDRILVMSAAHNLLSQSYWSPLSLRAIIEAVAPGLHHGCVTVDGPDILVSPRQVTAMGMVINELMTNSVKHGALQAPGGGVRIILRFQGSAANSDRLRMLWQEQGGPPVPGVPRPGLGTELIQGLVRSELYGEARLNYPPEGASHELLLTLERFGSRD